MQVDEVFDVILNLPPLQNSEMISLTIATGRVLFEDIYAKKSLPCFDNSALDGYAFNFEDRNNPLSIKGVIFAGDKNDYEISKNECYKIMTGAIFPKNADTVLRLEDEKIQNEKLIISDNVKIGNAKRLMGEEILKGEKILNKGEILTAAKIMLLASQGISYVKVLCLPKIAVFSSGNEINEPWQTCDDKSIYNANAFGIISLLLENGFTCEYKGVLPDNQDIIKAEISSAINYDVIVTSGGASKGEADFMKTALNGLGFEEIFSSIDIRPAKPTKLFKKANQLIFILPGNPLSCFISAVLSLIPALNKLTHQNPYKFINAKFNGNLKLKPTRANVVIGNLKGTKFTPTNENKFSPSMIKPLINSNSIYLSKIGENEITDEKNIKVIKFS